jgi:hypothetical protein
MRIVTITVLDENGKGFTWADTGSLNRIKTRIEVEGKPPSEWPTVTFLTAHLVPDPGDDS